MTTRTSGKRSPRLSEHERREHLSNLGQAIRSARGSLTQARLGALLEVPQTTVSRWEKGHVALDVIRIRELELALGLESGSLLIDAGLTTGKQRINDISNALLADSNVDAPLRRELITLYGHYVMYSKVRGR